MGGVNSNYHLLATQTNNNISTTSSDIAAMIQQAKADAAAQAAQDQAEYQITDDTTGTTDEVSGWEVANSLISTTLNGLSEVAKAFGNSTKNSSTTTTYTPSETTASSSVADALNAATNNFLSNPTKLTKKALASGIDAANGEVKKLNDDITKLETENQKLEAGDYKGVLGDLKTEADDAVAKKITAQGDLDKANGAVTTANGQLTELAGNLADVEGAQGRIESQTNDVITFKTAAGDTITVKKTEQAKAEEDVAQLVKDYSSCLSKIASLDGDITTLDTEIGGLKRDISGLESSKGITSLDNTSDKKIDDEIKVKNQQIAEKERIKGEKQTQKRTEESTKASLEQKIQIGKQTVADLSAAVTKAEGELQTANDQIDALGKEVSRYIDIEQTLGENYARVSDSKTQSEADAQNNARLIDNITGEQGSIENLTIDYEKAQEEAVAKIKENKQEIDNKKNELSELKTALNKANSAMASNPTEGGKALKKGDEVTIDGKTYTVVKNKDGKGVIVKDGNGKEFQLTYDGNGNMKIDNNLDTPDKPKDLSYEKSGATVKVGNTTYEVKDDKYGYTDKDGKFHVVGKLPKSKK